MSWGTFWLSIITPKKSQRPFKEKENVFKSQREFKVKTKKLPKARENAGDQIAIGLSFHLIGCRREWHDYSGPITERSTAISMKFRITWDTQLNTVLVHKSQTENSYPVIPMTMMATYFFNSSHKVV